MNSLCSMGPCSIMTVPTLRAGSRRVADGIREGLLDVCVSKSPLMFAVSSNSSREVNLGTPEGSGQAAAV